MIATNLLRNVKVTAPCPARWEDMDGDKRCRFCRHCQKHVYNFSAMTAGEVIKLIGERDGNACAQFYQRPDGTIMTSDCGLGVSRLMSSTRKVILGAAAGFVTLVSATFAEGSFKGLKERVQASKDASRTNLAMPMVLGKISCAPIKVSTNKVALTPTPLERLH